MKIFFSYPMETNTAKLTTPPMPVTSDDFANRKAPYHSRPVEVHVEFSDHEQNIDTLEGTVKCHSGDAILTGGMGERWVVPASRFYQKYQAAPGQVDEVSGRYTKRTHEVAAAQLHDALDVVLSEGRGTLSGKPGDWCVWYGPEDRAIVAAAIFPTLYESDAVSVYVQLGRHLAADDRQAALAVVRTLAAAMPHTPVVFTEESSDEHGPTWFRIVNQRNKKTAIIPSVLELDLESIAVSGTADLAAGVNALAMRESLGAYSMRKLHAIRAVFNAFPQESDQVELEPFVIYHMAAIEAFNARLKSDFGQKIKFPFIEERSEAEEPEGMKKLFAIGSVADTLASRYQTLWQKLVFATTADIADAKAWTLLRVMPRTLIGLGLFAAAMLAAFSELGGGCEVADPLGFAWCASALWEHWAAPLFFVAYILALGTAWSRYSMAKADRWEARHQDYRLLAECLRVLHVRCVLGEPGCVASDFPLAEPADSGWVLLALRSMYFDARFSGLRTAEAAAAQVVQALKSFVTPQLRYHGDKLLKRRERAIHRLSRMALYGFCLFALMLLTLVANVLGEILHHALLSPMLHHLVLIGLLLGLGSWGAMRKVVDSFGLEQEVQRGRLVRSALAVAQRAGSRDAVWAAADCFLDDQAHWHALHRSHPIEAATGG